MNNRKIADADSAGRCNRSSFGRTTWIIQTISHETEGAIPAEFASISSETIQANWPASRSAVLGDITRTFVSRKVPSLTLFLMQSKNQKLTDGCGDTLFS
jgi:hypothetical protein